MSEAKFTPGPWVVGYLKDDVGVADDGKTGGYAKLFDVRGWGYLTGKGHGGLGLGYDDAVKIQEANAHLIAAAPELYEMLQIARDYVSSELEDEKQAYKGYESSSNIPSIKEDLERIDAVLAKARGE